MGSISITFVMKEHKGTMRGCEVFLAHAIECTRRTVDLVDVEVVREFVMCSLMSCLVYHHHMW